MERTSIVADPQVLERLRNLARRRGVSLARLIREALEEKLEREQPPLTFIGTATDWDPSRPTARSLDEEDLYRPEPTGSRD